MDSVAENGRGTARPISLVAGVGTSPRLRTPGIAIALAVLSGCGGADETPTDESTSLKAVLSIERTEDAARGDAPSASALAHFVILPQEANADETLNAAGLRAQLPENVGCLAVTSDGSGNEATLEADGEQLELLEAGDVSIEAGSARTTLVLNAFPGSGSAAGVLYTTPDQSSTPLPADAPYVIDVSGSDHIPPLRIEGRSPETLDDVTVNDAPVAEAGALVAGEALTVGWREGEPGDRVYVELSDGDTRVLCAFADDTGTGSIPAGTTSPLQATEAAWFSIHRVRESVAAQEALPSSAPVSEALVLETMMRFNFELSTIVRVELP